MFAFMNGEIREVDIPDVNVKQAEDIYDFLELVFHYGQNDFQPMSMPSISVGDVAEYKVGDQKYWIVASAGFRPISEDEFQKYSAEAPLGFKAYQIED